MAVPTGIEPAISCVTGRHVNRYTTGPLLLCITTLFKKMAEEEGFEPPHGLTRLSVFKTDPFSRTWVFLRIWWSLAGSNRWPPACKAGALPAELSPLGNLINGREDRIRTCDPLVPNQVLYQAEPLPEFNGAPKRSRTPNLLIRSQMLYPIELWAHN